MYYEAFMLAARLASIGVIDRDYASSVAINAVEVVLDAGDDTLTGDPEKDARLLIVWQGRESAGRWFVVGDSGRSFGPMQINAIQWIGFLGIESRDLLHAHDGVQHGYTIMKHLKTVCGSVRGALRAYASGTCAGTIRARELVDTRCKESGAC